MHPRVKKADEHDDNFPCLEQNAPVTYEHERQRITIFIFNDNNAFVYRFIRRTYSTVQDVPPEPKESMAFTYLLPTISSGIGTSVLSEAAHISCRNSRRIIL